MTTSYEWKVGDRFRFNQANSHGGPEFGTEGDEAVITEILQKLFRTEYYFHFTYINKEERDELGYREEYFRIHSEGGIDHLGKIYVTKECMDRITVDYLADQESEDDDLL